MILACKHQQRGQIIRYGTGNWTDTIKEMMEHNLLHKNHLALMATRINILSSLISYQKGSIKEQRKTSDCKTRIMTKKRSETYSKDIALGDVIMCGWVHMDNTHTHTHSLTQIYSGLQINGSSFPPHK